jgi:hypothetical protein
MPKIGQGRVTSGTGSVYFVPGNGATSTAQTTASGLAATPFTFNVVSSEGVQLYDSSVQTGNNVILTLRSLLPGPNITISDSNGQILISSTGGSGSGATGPTGPAGTDSNVPGPTGPTGPSVTGPTGPAGAASSVTGPTGPAGASVTGPTGPAGTASVVPGPTGPAGAASSVTGPTGPAGASVTGPTGPAGADSTVPGPTGPTGPTGGVSVEPGPTGPTGPSFYDIVGYWRGTLPSDSDPIHYLEMVRDITLPINLTGSVASCLTAPTADVSLTLKKNGVSIGNIDFIATQSTGSFTFSSDETFSSGDIWEVDPPSPQDSTFAGLSWTIVGNVI